MTDSRDDAITRSEEELVVDTVWRPAERVRLRRRVVEEDVTVTVRVRREQLEIEREPVSRYEAPQREDAIEHPEEIVIVLREERPVVGVEVVPVERVRVRREIVAAGERTERDSVRREQVDLVRDDAPGPPGSEAR
jgi:stress response protein YsnF